MSAIGILQNKIVAKFKFLQHTPSSFCFCFCYIQLTIFFNVLKYMCPCSFYQVTALLGPIKKQFKNLLMHAGHRFDFCLFKLQLTIHKMFGYTKLHGKGLLFQKHKYSSCSWHVRLAFYYALPFNSNKHTCCFQQYTYPSEFFALIIGIG